MLNYKTHIISNWLFLLLERNLNQLEPPLARSEVTLKICSTLHQASWCHTGTGKLNLNHVKRQGQSHSQDQHYLINYRTNQAFKQRTEECEEAQKQLRSKLGMIQKEIKDQNNYIEKIKASIRAKGPPLKVDPYYLSQKMLQFVVRCPKQDLRREVTDPR